VTAKKPLAAGFTNAAHLAADKDLDALRQRDGFQKLQAALEAGQKKDPRDGRHGAGAAWPLPISDRVRSRNPHPRIALLW